MAQVKIAKEIPFADVALGLTLLCAPSGGTNQQMDEIRNNLLTFDHDTVFAEAFRIAESNNRKLFGRNATYTEFSADYDGRDALFLSAPGDNPVIGAICAGNVLSPTMEMSPMENADQMLFILTAMGIARPEPDAETVH